MEVNKAEIEPTPSPSPEDTFDEEVTPVYTKDEFRERLLKVMDFPEAIREVINGGRITKREWNNHQIYGSLVGDRLKINMADGSMHDWILSDGDLLGEDWMLLP